MFRLSWSHQQAIQSTDLILLNCVFFYMDPYIISIQCVYEMKIIYKTLKHSIILLYAQIYIYASIIRAYMHLKCLILHMSVTSQKIVLLNFSDVGRYLSI
jgi:hypothetical protein